MEGVRHHKMSPGGLVHNISFTNHGVSHFTQEEVTQCS